MLIGRTTELAYIEQQYHKSGSRMLIVYGLKQVGRTALLREFVKDKPVFYYASRECSQRQQRLHFAAECREQNRSIQNSLEQEVPAYGDLFRWIARNALVDRNGQASKVVLIIDEFQNMIKNDSSFMDELTGFLKDTGSLQELFVLLCSSSVEFIENNLISRIGTKAAMEIAGFLKVKELPFQDCRKLCPDLSLKQSLEVYAVLGGFPGLWVCWNEKETLKENLIRLFLKRDSLFLRHVWCYVEEELREPAVYNTLLAALASGKQKLNELFFHTGFSRAKISVYLKYLMELELVEKVFSYDSEGKANAKKGIYRIKNALVEFYFRYIYPHYSTLQILGEEAFYDRYIGNDYAIFAQPALKNVCAEWLVQQNAKQKLPYSFRRFGEWVGKIGMIDIVAQDEEKHTLLAFCRYEKNVVTTEDYEWLLFLAQKAKLPAHVVYLFSAGSFDENLRERARTDRALHLISFVEEMEKDLKE